MKEEIPHRKFEENQQELEIIQSHSKSCVLELEKVYFNSVFEFIEEANSYREALSEHLKKVALLYSREAFECFDSVFHKVSKRREEEQTIPIPDRSSRKTAQVELQEELKKHPDAYHSKFTQTYWDDFNRRHLEEKFVFGLYENLKTVFVKHYFEIILNMDSKDLRNFDRKLYRNATIKFAKAYYRLQKKVKLP